MYLSPNGVIMSTKRTFSFSERNLEQLEQLVPRSSRSRFVDSALARAIEQATKEKALEVLEGFQRVEVSGSSVVETQREIRKNESVRLVN